MRKNQPFSRTVLKNVNKVNTQETSHNFNLLFGLAFSAFTLIDLRGFYEKCVSKEVQTSITIHLGMDRFFFI